jgi:RimJ/RimL family protein N-acetyltransferase
MNPSDPLRDAGVEMIRPEHSAAIQELVTDPAIAEVARVFYPSLLDGAQAFVERCAKERNDGQAFVHVVTARTLLLGICGLHDVAPRQSAELRFWIGRPFWGKGLATFAVGNMLDFAFGPLHLERVFCHTLESSPVARHVLEKHGFRFRVEPRPLPLASSAGLLAHYEVAREEYYRHKFAPFLRELSPDLKPILDAELAAGNEIGDCTRGWPEKDSIIVALRKPFRSPTAPLPANVEYREVNDTHWWKAEYAAKKPVHLLTCGF